MSRLCHLSKAMVLFMVFQNHKYCALIFCYHWPHSGVFAISQRIVTCSKLTIETLEQGVKYVQSNNKDIFIWRFNFEHVSPCVVVFLLLTWNRLLPAGLRVVRNGVTWRSQVKKFKKFFNQMFYTMGYKFLDKNHLAILVLRKMEFFAHAYSFEVLIIVS